MGSNRGLISQPRPSIQEALKTSFAEFRNQLVPELCLAVRGAVVQAHSEVPLSRRASRETAVDTVEKSQTSGELRGGDFSHSTACLWQWRGSPVGVGPPLVIDVVDKNPVHCALGSFSPKLTLNKSRPKAVLMMSLLFFKVRCTIKFFPWRVPP